MTNNYIYVVLISNGDSNVKRKCKADPGEILFRGQKLIFQDPRRSIDDLSQSVTDLFVQRMLARILVILHDTHLSDA